jgi:hypothetical protein
MTREMWLCQRANLYYEEEVQEAKEVKEVKDRNY